MENQHVRTMQHQHARTMQHQHARTMQHQHARTMQHQHARTMQHQHARAVQHQHTNAGQHQHPPSTHEECKVEDDDTNTNGKSVAVKWLRFPGENKHPTTAIERAMSKLSVRREFHFRNLPAVVADIVYEFMQGTDLVCLSMCSQFLDEEVRSAKAWRRIIYDHPLGRKCKEQLPNATWMDLYYRIYCFDNQRCVNCFEHTKEKVTPFGANFTMCMWTRKQSV